MRYLLALLMSGALMFGCGDGSGGDAGSGGSGGVGGTAGAGGAGGGRVAETSRAYVVVLPIPPCEEGSASSYSVDNILVGPGNLEASFPNCDQTPDGERFTLMCPLDEDGIDYMSSLTRNGPGFRVSGRIQACNGFLLRDVLPARDEVVVDVFVAPTPPCEQGVPSNYVIDVFVDGATDPVVVTGDFGECTGGIDSRRNTITCPNDGASMPYSITVGEGLDWEVTASGTRETCGGFLLR